MKILLSAFFISVSVCYGQGCNLSEVTSTPNETDLCYPNSGTTVTTSTSELGVNYFLIDSTTGNTIDGPYAGTGSPINFTTGSLTQSTTFIIQGVLDQSSLDFDGIDDNVNCGGLNLTGDFTLEVWVKQGAIQNWPTFVSNIDYATGEGYWLGSNGDGQAEFYISVNSWVTGTSVLADGGWHHIVGVHENGEGRLYVDGVLESTEIMANSNATTMDFTIGDDSDPTAYKLEGQIDDVRVWSIARTEAEIQSAMDVCLTGSESNLEAYYTFENGPGSSTLTDLTGNGHDGTLIMMDPSTDWTWGPQSCCQLDMASTVTINVSSDSSTIATSGTNVLVANPNGTAYQWIDCDNGNQAINGETNQSYTMTTSGNYAVITSFGNCIDTSDCITASLGIGQLNTVDLIGIYPNPSGTGIYNINTDEQIRSIRVINSIGKEVAIETSKDEKSIKLIGAPSGAYFILVETNQGTFRTLITKIE